jgi:hypothetical protein
MSVAQLPGLNSSMILVVPGIPKPQSIVVFFQFLLGNSDMLEHFWRSGIVICLGIDPLSSFPIRTALSKYPKEKEMNSFDPP